MDCFFGKLDTLCANASPALRFFAQRTADESDPDLSRASAIQVKTNAKKNGRVFRVVVAAMARSDQQRCPSSLHSMLSSLAQDGTVYCHFSYLIFPFLTDVGPAQSRSRIVSDSFHTNVGTAFEQVVYTSSIVMTLCVPNSGTKNGFIFRRKTFLPHLCSTLLKLADWNAHRSR